MLNQFVIKYTLIWAIKDGCPTVLDIVQQVWYSSSMQSMYYACLSNGFVSNSA